MERFAMYVGRYMYIYIYTSTDEYTNKHVER